MRVAILLLTLVLQGFSQTDTLRLYSELTRIGPDGLIVAPDRGKPPRTILSPGVIRGAWASFRIVVEPLAAGKLILDVGQNPENATQVSMYREVFDANGIPDSLTSVKLPYEVTPNAEEKVLTFWMDLWVPRSAPVDRIKVEPQLWSNNDWFTYPMEVRILQPTLPEPIKSSNAVLPSVMDRADASTLGPLRAAYCGQNEKASSEAGNEVTVRQLLHRNALQHLALAKTKEDLKLALARAGAADICTEAPPGGPEWYLRFRDSLFGKER